MNVAAPIAGRLDQLTVKRGDEVVVGAALYVLEAESEKAAQRQAMEQVKAAEAQLDDLRRGRRVPEQDVVSAELGAKPRRSVSRRRSRATRRSSRSAASRARRWRTPRFAHTAAQARVRPAHKRARRCATAPPHGAGRRAVAQARPRRARSSRRLAPRQKTVAARVAGTVTDTLYREGEWVAAGGPVVACCRRPT